MRESLYAAAFEQHFQNILQSYARQIAWVGSVEAELILINDLRWSSEPIQWDGFLHLSEGQKVHLPTPKNLYAKDVSISNDTLIPATGSSTIKDVGKYNISDYRETETMKVRWRVFEFTSRISESDVKEIFACPRCFSRYVLMV